MNPRARAFAAAAALFVCSATFLVLSAARVATYRYLPLEHRWAWDVPPGAIGMDWFYRAGLALAAGAVAFPAALALGRRSARATRLGSIQLLMGVGFMALGWSAVFVVFSLVTAPR